jgi:hypothetical protein
MIYRVEVVRTESEVFYVDAGSKGEAENHVHNMILLDWDASVWDESVMAIPVDEAPNGKEVYKTDE